MSYLKGTTFRKNGEGVDLIGAIIAGSVVGCMIGWLRAFGEELDVEEFIRIIFLATSSYFLVALLSSWNDRRFLRKLPGWVFIPIIGSVLTFLSINLFGAINYIWRFRNSAAIGHATGAIQDEIVDLMISTLMNSLVALPLMGAVHYIGLKVVSLKEH